MICITNYLTTCCLPILSGTLSLSQMNWAPCSGLVRMLAYISAVPMCTITASARQNDIAVRHSGLITSPSTISSLPVSGIQLVLARLSSVTAGLYPISNSPSVAGDLATPGISDPSRLYLNVKILTCCEEIRVFNIFLNMLICSNIQYNQIFYSSFLTIKRPQNGTLSDLFSIRRIIH